MSVKLRGDYHDLYLKTDVHLLADVFEKFRCTAMLTYDLDPTHYYTLPGFAWALLKHTEISLALLTELRKKAVNEFDKDFFKLMNNMNNVSGKTMENVRRRISVKLLRAEEEEDVIRAVHHSTVSGTS